MLTLLNLFQEYSIRTLPAGDAYIVGGTVRDLLMERQVRDADIVVKGNTEQVARSFADAIGASFVLLDRDFGIARVAKDGEFIDICTMYGGSILDDLANRDITINAMAVPLPYAGRNDIENYVIDPCNGLNDMKYKIIRMVSEVNLVKDPLRLLRIYRFAAELGFGIEVHTSSAVRANAALITRPASERISEELRHILRIKSSYRTIREMEKDSLLFNLFPDLATVSQETWHHTKQSYGYAEHILDNLPLYFPGRSNPMEEYFADRTRIFCLKLALLLRDTAILKIVSERLNLSRRESDFIDMVTGEHNTVIVSGTPLRSVITGLLRKFGDDIYALLVFVLSSERSCQLSGNSSVEMAREAVAIYHDEFIPRLSRLPLIDGNDLISELGLSPSPLFKEILSEIELMALEGRITSREEALARAGQMMKKRSK